MSSPLHEFSKLEDAKNKTLRDEFAMSALPFYLNKIGPKAGAWGAYSLNDAARDAYVAAAAMMKERVK